MKTKTQWFVAALFAVMITINLGAQTGGGGDGDITVIQGQDLTRDLGVRLTHRGSIYYSCPSIDWDYAGTRTSTEVTGKYAEDVFAQLMAFKYDIRLKNPADIITVRAYGNDDNGDALFYGQAEFKIGQKPKIQTYQWRVPILKNVQSAEVIPLNEDGTSGQSINMDVSSHGQLFWTPWMSGAPNGLLAVKYTDGTLVTYRLSKPVGQNPLPVEGAASLAIQGHYTYKIAVGFDVPVIDIVEVWNRPTVFFTCGGMDVTFNVRGVVQLPNGSTMLERPSGMTLTDENGDNPFPYKLSTTEPTKIRMSDGKHRVRSFDWNLFGQPGLLYTGPSGGVVPVGGGGGSKGSPEPTAVQ